MLKWRLTESLLKSGEGNCLLFSQLPYLASLFIIYCCFLSCFPFPLSISVFALLPAAFFFACRATEGRFMVLANNNLQIHQVTKADEGVYRCEASVEARGEIDFVDIAVVVNGESQQKICN